MKTKDRTTSGKAKEKPLAEAPGKNLPVAFTPMTDIEKQFNPNTLIVSITEKGKAVLAGADALLKRGIKTAEDMIEATRYHAALGDAEKGANTQRLAHTADLRNAVDRMNAAFNAVAVPWKNVRDLIGKAMIEKRRVDALAAQALADEQNAANAKLQEKEDKRAEKEDREPVKVAPTAVAVIPDKVGEARFDKYFDFIVEDINKIPAEFLEVRRGPLLKELARTSGAPMAGIKIEQKERPVS